MADQWDDFFMCSMPAKAEEKESKEQVKPRDEELGDLIRLSSNMATAVETLLQHKGEAGKVVQARPVPVLRKFSGLKGEDVEDWIRDAKEHLEQLGVTGSEAVAYLCGSLERPALTRVRNQKVSSVEGLFECLEEAWGPRLSYLELEQQLRERVQTFQEGVWEFADALWEIEKKMQRIHPRVEEERLWLWKSRFCRNLEDRKVGVKMQKWVDKEPGAPWETLVRRVDEKMRERDRIKREEDERRKVKGVENSGRGMKGRGMAKPCILCGKEGHLGYQCTMFKAAGNE